MVFGIDFRRFSEALRAAFLVFWGLKTRLKIEGFDANRSKKEYAVAFGYATTTNKKGDIVFLPKNGKGLANIPEAVAKAFGVRIPSQDMHSSINLKLVDFMPAYYGSTAVFPDSLIDSLAI